jgi:pimeloyl-ACP methyl ester carboxylesterase
MAGGPGANAISQAGILALVGLNQNRDLIIMNQRGVADTVPALTCPEIDKFNAVAVGLPYDDPATGVLHVVATKACHDRLIAQGIDLSAFNTSENSADFADLRKALKIEQRNVYGLSHDTDLALSPMRDHPQGIRSVIIDSVVPQSAATLGWTA